MSGTELVVLKGGVSVPARAYVFAIELEARGLRLAADGDDLLVGPRDRITDDDRATLRAYKPALRAILDYQAPGVM